MVDVQSGGLSSTAYRSREFESHRRRSPLANNSVHRSYDLLRSQMLRDLVPGIRLSEADLVRDLSASRTTVRRVLSQLANEGLVTRAPRVGTVIAEQNLEVDADIRQFEEYARTGNLCLVPLEIHKFVPPPMIKGRLRIDIGDEVAFVEGRILACDRPVGVVVGYVVIDALKTGHVAEKRGCAANITTYVEHVGRPIRDVRIGIASMRCDDGTGRELGITKGSPILRVENELFDSGGGCRAVITVRYNGTRVAVMTTQGG